jgi:hypothetical protein
MALGVVVLSRGTMPRATKSASPTSSPRKTGPTEIAPGVFVGGWDDALTFEGSKFCVLDEAPDDMPKATHVAIYREVGDRADPQSLDRVAKAMRSARSKGDPVLVFCGHGVRRSPLAGMWYLRRAEGLSLDEAYDRVRAVRPKVEHPRKWLSNAAELERA